MKSQVKTITPSMAQRWLENSNGMNRNLNKNRVEQYASDMRSGSWALSHQGIAFDDGGELCDGQHRLAAIVLADKPVDLMVTTGLPRTVQNGVLLNIRDVMDRGQPRQLGQQLSMSHGVTHANLVAGACRAIATICTASDARITTAQCLKILDIFGDDIKFIVELNWARGRRKSGVFGTLAFAMGVNRLAVAEFATKLASMDSVPAKSAVYALDRYLSNYGEKLNFGGSRTMTAARVVASCLVRHLEGIPLEKVSGSEEALDYLRKCQKAKVKKVCEAMGVV